MKKDVINLLKESKIVTFCSRMICDETYLKMIYRIKLGKKLNLDNPKTFNEKLQWLKLHDRKDIYTTMVDKYEVKKYVADIIGEEYIIPTLGVYDKFDDIDFSKLPKQFVIKCTHDSDDLIICKDKTKLDKNEISAKIGKNLKNNYYYLSREWPYKNVKPRIIVEKYMEDKNNKSMRDYKIFCFDGKPKMLYISDDSHTADQAIAFFDLDYNYLPIERSDYKNYKVLPQKPKNFNRMLELSTKLANNIPHVRIDWYEINGKLYFGEITFYTCSGFIPFKDEKWDYKLGSLLTISK